MCAVVTGAQGGAGAPTLAAGAVLGTLRVDHGDAVRATGAGRLTRATLRRGARRSGLRISPRARTGHDIAGPHRIVALLVNFPDDQRTPFTVAEARDAIFGSPTSVRAYYTAMSDGRIQFTGDVFGWLRLPNPAGAVCDPDRWGDEARVTAATAGVDLTTADHIVYIWPRGRCGGTSLGSQRPLEGFKDPSTVPQVWMDGDISLRALAHEIGHNLGLMHAFGLECRGPESDRVTTTGVCFGAEYQDPFGVMGGADSIDLREWGFALPAIQRRQLGWLGDSRSAAVTATSTVTLEAIEAGGTGLAEVRIPRCGAPDGSAQHYSVEYRQPVRFDAGPADAAPSGIYVRLARTVDRFDPADATSVATHSRVFLVDTTPATSTFLDSGLGVGGMFVDVAEAITIRPLTADAGRASVAISLGPDTIPPSTTQVTSAIVEAPRLAPERLGRSLAERSPRGVDLAWQAASDCGAPAVGYRVLRDGVTIGSTSGLTFKDVGATGLRVGSTVHYSVQTVDRAGNLSGPSEDALVTLPDLTAPSRPSLAAAIVDGRVEVRWAVTSGAAARYSVYRDGKRLGSTARLRFRDTLPSPGVTHRYRVVAADAAGNLSPPSEPASLTLPVGRVLRVGRFSLTKPATVAVTLRSGERVVATFRQQGREGPNWVVIPARIARRLALERYTVEVAPSGLARLRSPARFSVRIATGRTSPTLQG